MRDKSGRKSINVILVNKRKCLYPVTVFRFASGMTTTAANTEEEKKVHKSCQIPKLNANQ